MTSPKEIAPLQIARAMLLPYPAHTDTTPVRGETHRWLRTELPGGRHEHLRTALDGGEIDPVDDGVRSLAGRPEDHGRNACAGEDRRVHPGGPAEHRRYETNHALCVRAHQAHDLGVGGDLERRPDEPRAHFGPQLGVGGRRSVDEIPHLLLDELGALARYGAALELDEAALGIARQLLPAGDPRGVQRAPPEQRLAGPAREPPAEVLDARQDAAGLGDRIDAELRLRAVRRTSRDLDLEP